MLHNHLSRVLFNGIVSRELWSGPNKREPAEPLLPGSPATGFQSDLTEDGLRRFETNKPFEGVVHNLQRRWRETDSGIELKPVYGPQDLEGFDPARQRPLTVV